MATPLPDKPRPKRRRAGKKRKSASSTTAAPARPATSPHAERRARRALISGSALLLLGLAMVGVDTTDVGAAITLLGLLILIFGIHSYGRLGPDEPEPAEPANA